MNKEVSYKLAVLLKEKGYTTPCFYYYENEKLVEPFLENGSSTDTEFRVWLSDLQEYFNEPSKRISAPTIAEVVMWLYEKYGIWITVIPELFNGVEIKYYSSIYEQGIGEDIEEYYNSLTEAYEAGIEYILKTTQLCHTN